MDKNYKDECRPGGGVEAEEVDGEAGCGLSKPN